MTSRQRFLAARLAYVAIVLLATLTNLEFSSNLSEASTRLLRAVTPSLGWRDAVDGLRNLVLFAGLGGVWVLTSLTGDVRRAIRQATVTSFALSTLVEGLQVFSPIRDASIIDVTTNTLGGLGGAIVTALLIAAIQSARREKSYLGIPTLLIAGPYALAVLCEALAPLFRSEPLPFLEGGPMARLQTAIDLSKEFDWNEIPVLDVPLYIAAGFVLVAYIRERRGSSKHQWWMASAVCAAILVAAHVIHGAFGLAIRWEAVVTDVLSITFGAWVAHRWLGRWIRSYRGSARPRAAIFIYIGHLVLWAWRPLYPEIRWEKIAAQVNAAAFIPLASLADRVDAFSALHVAQQFLLYLPLGALLAVWPLRMKGRWADLWPAVWLALALEIGHIVTAERMFDLTNTLLAFAGLAIGWIVVRRCGFQPYGAALPSRR